MQKEMDEMDKAVCAMPLEQPAATCRKGVAEAWAALKTAMAEEKKVMAAAVVKALNCVNDKRWPSDEVADRPQLGERRDRLGGAFEN